MNPQQASVLSPLDTLLNRALEKRELRPLDLQFARFIGQQGGDERLQLAAALVSEALGEGHSCLPLERPLEHWSPLLASLCRRAGLSELQPDQLLLGDGSVPTPLVRANGALYLYRYWQYEQQVAAGLRLRARAEPVDGQWLRAALDRLFSGDESPDWQRVAAAVALSHRLAVISGGPGTGKTTTVVKMLALWLEHALGQGRQPLIRLAAPTGKAAARLAESIANARDKLPVTEQIRQLIPEEASTLHRLLGSLPGTRRFRHHRDNPLHLDLLVVDEASMVDLPLMARLLDALPADAQLLLIGDRDQLASVEAGGVLGDICGSGVPRYSPALAQLLADSCDLPGQVAGTADLPEPDGDRTIADCLALLHKSYRFHAQSGIGHLARAVNDGDLSRLQQVLQEGYADIELTPADDSGYRKLIGQAVNGYRDYLLAIGEGAGPEQVLRLFGQCQLLCALREGPFGVAGLNEAVEQALSRAGLIRSDSLWYVGRPVMISRNEPALNLFNGDIGIALPDADGALRVWFDQQGEPRPVLPSRLPEHQTVYAMTIHKSQGSEFDRVLMVLPSDDTPVLTRELVYTGITRAKQRCELYSNAEVLAAGVRRRTQRSGGLHQLLWSEPSAVVE
ncbi:exodeoxyribonuclease V subunit alpha [Marinobacterium arenosum]|uniref:exodeoxyribonuclease V subunit alpha n=1 Tax=Marinobacterium arenosum TaxID=2862496 RepID=UPI001C93DE98|nr:exodeoxyribonuclease V subunit alpha [Marinobacterium arenosum]MBY4678196.1 exodeoxyribonuclease V subunit alpha [Marinobacterium arenosum]